MADVMIEPVINAPVFLHVPLLTEGSPLLQAVARVGPECVHGKPGDLLRAICRAPLIAGSCASHCREQETRPEPASAPTKQRRQLVGTPPIERSSLSVPDDHDDATSHFQTSGRLAGCDGDDDTALEVALKPILRDILARGTPHTSPQKGGCKVDGARWWARACNPLLCPLTQFPICLLPYPPFKVRVDPKRAIPNHLVDGKFLAMSVVAFGSAAAWGRQLQASDLSALDKYVQRCKLGPYRPGRAAQLREHMEKAKTTGERLTASQELDRLVGVASAELGKLRRIQEHRMAQIRRSLPVDLQALLKVQSKSMAKLC